MWIELHPDVERVLVFMQSQIPAAHLTAVAAGIARIAPALWGHHQAEEVAALRLVQRPISGGDPLTQSSATGCAPGGVGAGDGSAEAEGCSLRT